MRLRKDKAPGPSGQLKVVSGGQPIAAPSAQPTAAAPEQAISIPDSLTRTFRVTAGGTDAVMAVVTLFIVALFFF